MLRTDGTSFLKGRFPLDKGGSFLGPWMEEKFHFVSYSSSEDWRLPLRGRSRDSIFQVLKLGREESDRVTALQGYNVFPLKQLLSEWTLFGIGLSPIDTRDVD